MKVIKMRKEQQNGTEILSARGGNHAGGGD